MKTKKMMIVTLLVMLMLTTSFPARGKASAEGWETAPEKTATEKKNAEISEFSEEQCSFFGDLVGEFVLECFQGHENLQLPDSIQSLYVDNDEMYFVLQRQNYLIEAMNIMGGGQIHELSLQEVSLRDVQSLSNTRIQVKAYVKLAFRYVNDREQRQTGMGMEVLATLLKSEKGTYKIERYIEKTSDFDAMQSDFVFFCRQAEQGDVTEQRKLTDQYFAKRILQLLEAKEQEKYMSEKTENIVEEYNSYDEDLYQEPASPNRLSVSYNRSRATTYALNEGPRTEELIFYSIPIENGGDCTNFVSQAIWVGYGGDLDDYFNYLNLYPNSSYLYNCKLWAWQKNRMVTGYWSGASKYADSFYYPTGSWMRVWQLWSYLSTTSLGPRADKYNDGDYYYSTSLIVQAGDILQFSPNLSLSPGYKHSVIVVNDAYQNLSGTDIYVAQHSANTGWRQLAEVICSLGPYVRIIRPIAGSFVE